MRTDSPLPPIPRQRHDGWTPDRQMLFLGELRRSRNVSRAAQAAGMNRKSAYRLRERPAGAAFAAAWDRTLRVVPTPARAAHRWPGERHESHSESLTFRQRPEVSPAPSLGKATNAPPPAIRELASMLSISEGDLLAAIDRRRRPG